MRIKEKIEGDVAVLTLSGRMMGPSDTGSFTSHIKNLTADGISKVVVDLGKMRWMNSTGLGALMAAMTSLRKAEGDLRLANVTEKVESLLIITQLIRIFETFDSVERGVASFISK